MRPDPAVGVDAYPKINFRALHSSAYHSRVLQHAVRWMCFTQHDRAAAAHDAGLFAPDRLAIRAQPFLMIQIDRGDHGNVGIDQVYCIEAPAHAHLEHRNVDVARLEHQQRRQGAGFEPGQCRITTHALDPRKRAYQFDVVDRHAVNANPFVVGQQVRRGIAAHRAICGAQDGVDERHGGALAIGSANGEHDRRRALQPQSVGDFAHAIQAHRNGLRVHALPMQQPLRKRGER